VNRRGFSLLEVILALAILGGAVAVLGEAASLAMRNAEFTRDMARAQLLCEGKLAEIVGGITSAQPIQRAVIATAADASEPAWLYSVETAPLSEEGLMSLRVTVTRDFPAARRPVQFSLVRWIPDPNASSSTSSDQSAQQTGGAGGAP
jgi:prepilin-type N-terminal cleavage/methylation domain-containing protein